MEATTEQRVEIKRKKKRGGKRYLRNTSNENILNAEIKQVAGERGRYLVAGKALPRGTVVFQEKAYSWTPMPHVLRSVCSACTVGLDSNSETMMTCEDCNSVFYCSHACAHSESAKHNLSCAAFAKLESVANKYDADPSLLRLVIDTFSATRITEKSIPSDNIVEVVRADVQQIMDLHFHNNNDTENVASKQSRGLSSEWNQKIREALEELYPDYPTKARATKHQQMAQRVYENIQGLDDYVAGGLVGAGIFPRVALLNHSCVPSCVISRQGDTLFVHTITDVQAGDELTISYIDLYSSKQARQNALLQQRFFTCECSRCVDPSTDRYLTGVLCKHCNPNASLAGHFSVDRNLPAAITVDNRCIKCQKEAASHILESPSSTCPSWIFDREKINSLWAEKRYDEAFEIVTKLLTETQHAFHPYHEDLFALYPLGMNYCRYKKDWTNANKWVKLILSCMDHSGAFPDVYPEKANYLLCQAEQYQNMCAALNAKSRQIVRKKYHTQMKEAIERALRVRIICYGPTHPLTLEARVALGTFS